jgi:error-prone DNA polymerase
MTDYAELHCHSHFSLLDGASSPESLVEQAVALGLHSLALTDHDSLAGAVPFWMAAQRAGLHALLGAEVTLVGHHHLTLLAETQTGYANLCRLITASRMDQLEGQETWPGKVQPSLSWERLAAHKAGLIALSGCRRGPIAEIKRLLDIFGRCHLYVELQRHALPDDDRRIRRLLETAHSLDLPIVAANNVHYAKRQASRLRDALIAIRHNRSLHEAQRAGLLPANSNYALADPVEMAIRFRETPEAIANTLHIAERCHVSLDFSARRLPLFPTPAGRTEYDYLYELCHENLRRRYPDIYRDVISQLARELEIIDRAGLCGYFLIVWDIIREARERRIRCQGRGSAANSIVAYILGITNIDPLRHNLLFERFLAEDRFTCPDIDIDFAAGEQREAIIQYVYQRYGHDHTAMVCNIVTYQGRSALRDLAKALDFPAPVIDRLAKALDTHSASAAADSILRQVDTHAPNDHPLRLLADLMRQIDGCPRHLSIHSGGMLITGPPLDEIVPLEPATMEDRRVAQLNKDMAEDIGLIKIDLLGLRMLGLLDEALGHIQATEGQAPDIDALSLDDPEIYAMLKNGDTIGAFQVESRAQQQMLPRLKPERFEDIIVEIAIIRPGPIQGDMVHPYLRRRSGLEPVTYPHPLLKPELRDTLGVLLFQEQVLRVAVVIAGFTPGEADMLRRALSRSRPGEEMTKLRQRFVQGAQGKGIGDEQAGAIFDQLAGYAGYGFCKSHSASFALIAYQSLWLRRYYPAPFYCALLNQQPMGFYSSEVVIGDARRHGVDLLPPDIHRSHWQYTVERTGEAPALLPTLPLRAIGEIRGKSSESPAALRTGLSAVKALGEQGWQRIEQARNQSPFQSLDDFCQRTRLPTDIVANLIRAGALDAFGERRPLLWRLGEIDYRPHEFDLVLPTIDGDLPALEPLEQTLWEYELMGLSPSTQVISHYRQALRKAGVLSTWQVKHETEAGHKVWVAGMVAVRQRPPTAHGITFISLEDESGLLDLVVKPDVYHRLRDPLHSAHLLIAGGIVQRAEGATSVLVHHATPLTA